MKNKKRNKILFWVLVCMLLSACGQEKKEKMPDTEETDYIVEGEAFSDDQKEADEDIIPAQKADIPNKANESARALTAEELQSFDELIQQNGNYGFLLSAYDTPADANLNEVFYNGLGADQEIITEDEVQAYLKAVGESELFADFNKITATQLNDFLLEKTGETYSAVLDYLAATLPDENVG